MIGGTVEGIIPNRAVLLVQVRDKVHGDICWFRIERTGKTDCIGTGDSLWWQAGTGFWTPQASSRQRQGKDFDIPIGRCTLNAPPGLIQAVQP